MKECKGSKHYMGLFPPSCNNGKVCDRCKGIYKRSIKLKEARTNAAKCHSRTSKV